MIYSCVESSWSTLISYQLPLKSFFYHDRSSARSPLFARGFFKREGGWFAEDFSKWKNELWQQQLSYSWSSCTIQMRITHQLWSHVNISLWNFLLDFMDLSHNGPKVWEVQVVQKFSKWNIDLWSQLMNYSYLDTTWTPRITHLLLSQVIFSPR